ncbi:MAG: HupE/UreJ family protein [Acidimicrobiia bacterium]|nr:HupE/UreJ family protein [Acidimicrobiia bacterium]
MADAPSDLAPRPRHRWVRPLVGAGAAVATWLAVGGVAAAHPHHAPATSTGLGEGFLHPIVGWDHLLAMVAVGVVAATASDRRVAWATPAAFVSAMVVGGLVGLGTGAAAGVEVLIAVSLLALGGLVAFGSRRTVWYLPTIAAVFGAVHGHAHGAELPAGALPFGYVVGFVVATALLHAAGAAGAMALRNIGAARLVAGGLVALGGLFALAGV